MARALKVYERGGFRRDCPEEEDRHGQTREYVAAHSKTEAARVFTASGPRDKVTAGGIHETGWPDAVRKCTAKPLTVFWLGLAGSYRSDGPIWHEAAPKGGG